VTACAEGAIALVDGKARLISETYCDGLGACLGECPRGAIQIEEREAEAFDEEAVRRHLAGSRPAVPATAPDPAAPPRFTCPSAALRELRPRPSTAAPASGDLGEPSALGHWPIQLMLVPPGAPFLRGADLLVCADCVPFVVPDFHRRYLSGRAVLVGCPKLDDLEHYREKLRDILAEARPRSLLVARMEVPCCGGIAMAAREARDAVMPELPLEVHVLGIRG
jgi:hypothetical protein